MNRIMKKSIILFFLILSPIKALALIEVDITRGNLNPLPIAVSPLSIDETSKKGFEKILDKYLPEFEQQVSLKLPQLKPSGKTTSNIKLPKLKKK